MDRAPDFESVGCEFESRRGRLICRYISQFSWLLFWVKFYMVKRPKIIANCYHS
jgi:hypothetical protein